MDGGVSTCEGGSGAREVDDVAVRWNVVVWNAKHMVRYARDKLGSLIHDVLKLRLNFMLRLCYHVSNATGTRTALQDLYEVWRDGGECLQCWGVGR